MLFNDFHGSCEKQVSKMNLFHWTEESPIKSTQCQAFLTNSYTPFWLCTLNFHQTSVKKEQNVQNVLHLQNPGECHWNLSRICPVPLQTDWPLRLTTPPSRLDRAWGPLWGPGWRKLWTVHRQTCAGYP